MKRILLICICLIIVFSGCQNYNRLSEVNLEGIENSFNNNFLNSYSPTIGYIDKTLIFQETINLKYNGIYAIKNQDCSRIDNSDATTAMENNPLFFTFNKHLYMKGFNGENVWYKYDEKSNAFFKSSSNISLLELSDNANSDETVSLNYLVYVGDYYYVLVKDNTFSVRYYKTKNSINKNNYFKNFKSDKAIDDLYIYDDKIYYSWNGYFDMYDIKQNSVSESLASTNVFYVESLLYYNENLFFIDKDALYKLSLKDKTFTCVLDKNVNALNATADIQGVSNQIFVTADDGIYRLINNKTEKISEIVTDNILIFDKKWIYTANESNGEKYRLTFDGKTTEKVFG